MNFFELIKRRTSIRKFMSAKIEQADIELLLNAANDAPSAGNLQAYEIDVVLNEEKKEELAKASLGQRFVAQAPVVFVFLSVPHLSSCKYGTRGYYYSLQDTTIACAYMQLAATEMGLASCWVGAFEDGKVKKILNAPEGWHPMCILPVGFAGEDGCKPERRPLTYNSFP